MLDVLAVQRKKRMIQKRLKRRRSKADEYCKDNVNHLGHFIPRNLSKEGAELGELGELEFSSRRPECIVSTRLD